MHQPYRFPTWIGHHSKLVSTHRISFYAPLWSAFLLCINFFSSCEWYVVHVTPWPMYLIHLVHCRMKMYMGTSGQWLWRIRLDFWGYSVPFQHRKWWAAGRNPKQNSVEVESSGNGCEWLACWRSRNMEGESWVICSSLTFWQRWQKTCIWYGKTFLTTRTAKTNMSSLFL